MTNEDWNDCGGAVGEMSNPGEKMDEQEKKAWVALDNRVLSSGHLLTLREYSNGRGALQAITPDGVEVECTVTVNLVDEKIAGDEFHVRFEARKHSDAVFQALIADGIAEPTGKVVSAGWVERYAEVWRLS